MTIGAFGIGFGVGIAALISGAGGASGILGTDNGLALASIDDTMLVNDSITPANAYNGSAITKFGNVRTTPAMCFGPDGFLRYGPENLILRSQELDHGIWTPVGIAVTPNDQTAPDGTLTGETFVANVGGTSGISQTYTAAGPVNTLSVYAKNLIGNGWLRLNLTNNGAALNLAAWFKVTGAGSVGTVNSGVLSANIVALPNGWYRCSITGPATVGIVETAYVRMAGADASGVSQSGWSIAFWGAQLERASAVGPYLPTVASVAYGLRRDYDPRLANTPEKVGFLTEEARTNLAFNTLFGGAGTNVVPTNWTFAGGTGNWSVVPSLLGNVDGAQAINFVSVAERPFWTSNTIALSASTTYVFSAYIEAKISGGAAINNVMAFNSLPAGATVTYRMNGAPAIGSTQVEAGRVEVIVAVDVTAGSTVLRLGVGTGSAITGNFIISRPQFEQGLFATSYIPTGVGVTANRAADLPTLAGTLFPLNQAEGTLYAKYMSMQPVVSPASQYFMTIDDNTINENHFIYKTNASLPGYGITDGGVNQCNLQDTLAIQSLVAGRVAGAYKLNDMAAAFGINPVQLDNVGTMPTTNKLVLGNRSDGTRPHNGWLLESAYFSVRKSNSDVQKLASGYPSDAALMLADLDGIAFSANDRSMVIKDSATPANNFSGRLSDKLGPIRTSPATCYGPTGLLEWGPENLILRSQEFDNAGYWSAVQLSVTGDQIVAPDGTLTGDLITEDTSNNVHRIFRTGLTAAIAGNQTLSLYVKAGTATWIQLYYNDSAVAFYANFNVVTGVTGNKHASATSRISDAGNGWWRCELTMAGTAFNGSNAQIYMLAGDTAAAAPSYLGTGKTLYIWGIQLERAAVATSYKPTTVSSYYGLRLDYDSRLGSSGPGYLIEEARVNICLRSQEFDTTWVQSRVTVTPNATTAPDGTMTADKLVEDSSLATDHRTFQPVNTTAATWTFSVFAKAAERTWIALRIEDNTAVGRLGFFNLATGALGSTPAPGITQTIQALPNGWYRCAVTIATGFNGVCNPLIAIAEADNDIVFDGTGTQGLYVWGAQCELGAWASSYTPTTTVAVAQAKDDTSGKLPITAFPFSFVNWSAYAKFTMIDLNATRSIVTVGVSANDRLELRNNVAAYRMLQISGGANQAVLDAGTITPLVKSKMAARFAINNVRYAYTGGILSALDNLADMPLSAPELALGQGITGTGQMNGWLHEFTGQPVAWNDATLQAKAA